MKLSIITLTYNNLVYTKKFIESLYKYTKDFELIIVDNGSTDGTVEYLKTLDGLKLILNKENQGFSKGNNQGIEIAQGEYIGFLNNDILLYPNWFVECEKVFNNEKTAAFVSPAQINPNFDNISEKNYLIKFKPNPETPYRKTFDDCQLACAVTEKSVLDKIGGFDEEFTPAFFEDNDLKYRAIEAGYDTYVTNCACFFHYSSVTSAKLNQNFEKNKAYYFQKHRFAEYLSLYAFENQEYKERARAFSCGFLNFFYKIYIFYKKVIRNIKRIFCK